MTRTEIQLEDGLVCVLYTFSSCFGYSPKFECLRRDLSNCLSPQQNLNTKSTPSARVGDNNWYKHRHLLPTEANTSTIYNIYRLVK